MNEKKPEALPRLVKMQRRWRAARRSRKDKDRPDPTSAVLYALAKRLIALNPQLLDDSVEWKESLKDLLVREGYKVPQTQPLVFAMDMVDREIRRPTGEIALPKLQTLIALEHEAEEITAHRERTKHERIGPPSSWPFSND